MTAIEVLSSLEDRGVILGLNDGRLRIDAPRGALTPELRTALSSFKDELVALLISTADAEKTNLENSLASQCPQCASQLRHEESNDGHWILIDCLSCGRYAAITPKIPQKRQMAVSEKVFVAQPNLNEWTWYESDNNTPTSVENVASLLTKASEDLAVIFISRDKLKIGVRSSNSIADDLLNGLLTSAGTIVKFLKGAGLSDNYCWECSNPLRFEYDEQSKYCRVVCRNCKQLRIW
jgi:hypothetical protein